MEAWIKKNTPVRRTVKLMHAQPLKFVAVCRVSPYLPYTPTNYTFGVATDIPAASFVVVSIPFAFPGIFLWTSTGSALAGVTVRAVVAHILQAARVCFCSGVCVNARGF